MSEDIVKLRGTFKAYQDDRGGASLIPHPVIGIVKNNVDPMHSGKIQVYINRLNSSEDDNPAYWTTVSYMSPFFGYTPNTGSPDSDGKYINNPNSYGFWATPPDIGTQVVCIFVNGDPNFGYYIGGIPIEGLIHMTPAVGASSNVIPNTGEADGYGGATRLMWSRSSIVYLFATSDTSTTEIVGCKFTLCCTQSLNCCLFIVLDSCVVIFVYC